MSDADLGIVFAEIPLVEGDAADVYNWIATYETEYWRMMTTNEVSPAFAVFTSAEVQARMAQIAGNNAGVQAQVGGVFHVAVGSISVDGDAASGTACGDYRDVTFADVDGTYTPAETGFGEPILVEVTLARTAAEGVWYIGTAEVIGAC